MGRGHTANLGISAGTKADAFLEQVDRTSQADTTRTVKVADEHEEDLTVRDVDSLLADFLWLKRPAAPERTDARERRRRKPSPEREEQAELGAMFRGGVERFSRQVERARKKSHATVIPGERHLLEDAVDAVAEGVSAWYQRCKAKGKGTKPVAYRLLYDKEAGLSLGCEVVAFVALKTLTDRLLRDCERGRDSTHQNVMYAVGRRLEFEMKADTFLRTHLDCQNLQGTPGEVRQLFSKTMKARGFEWPPWTDKQRMYVGDTCLTIIRENTDLIEFEAPEQEPEERDEKKPMYVVRLTGAALSRIREVHRTAEVARPVYLPMVCKPRPWTTATEGGYLLPGLFEHFALVATRGYEDRFNGVNPGDCPDVFRAVNAIQGTPWRINRKLLAVALKVWPLEKELAGKDKRARESFVAQRERYLKQARAFAGEERFWLPVQLDFRGRLNYVPALNPQGSDLVRALLEFADAKPWTSEGFWQFGVYGAQLYGEVLRASDDDLFSWCATHYDRVQSAVADPLGNSWWRGAKKPWRFLRWCFEHTALLSGQATDGTRLPVYVDGSCNGIQHIAALLRDWRAAEAVNLCPQQHWLLEHLEMGTPMKEVARKDDLMNRQRDLYGEVAQLIWLHLMQDNCWSAQVCDRLKIDRDLLKAVVMTLPYGATSYRRRKHFGQALAKAWAGKVYVTAKRGVEGGPPPLIGGRAREMLAASLASGPHYVTFREIRVAAAYLEKLAMEMFGRIVPKADEFMRAMGRIGSAVAKAGQHLEWLAPTGFPVRQRYFEMEQDTPVQTSLGERTIQRPTDRLNVRKSGQAAAANLIHSLDAAHLVKAISRCRDRGVTHFVTIHDSFGTHASDIETLKEELREAFAEIHAEDLLGKYHSQWSSVAGQDLPSMPESGDWNPALVRHAKYDFT